MRRGPEGFNPSSLENIKNPETEEKPNKKQTEWLSNNKNVSIERTQHGGGAGGQNKNKVSSAADLRWHIVDADPNVFSSEEQKKLVEHFSKIPSIWAGSSQEVHLVGTRQRDFEANRKAVLNRLFEEVKKALFVGKERKDEVPNSVKAKRERLKKAAQQAERKQKNGFDARAD